MPVLSNRRRNARFSVSTRVVLLRPFTTGDRRRSYDIGARGNVLQVTRRGFRLVEMDDAGEIYVSTSFLEEA